MTSISFERVFSVDIHYCPHGRFVEMFATWADGIPPTLLVFVDGRHGSRSSVRIVKMPPIHPFRLQTQPAWLVYFGLFYPFSSPVMIDGST